MINSVSNNKVLTPIINNNSTFPQAQPAEAVSGRESVNLTGPVSSPSLVAYSLAKLNGTDYKTEVKFFNAPSVPEMVEKYGAYAINNITDLKSRASKEGQVLNWINTLPQTQLKRLDEIYSLADEMKKNGNEKLGIIGIGGSKHTVENLLSLTGKSDKAVFLSSVDPKDIDKFLEKLGDFKNAVIMVASKSGTTLEPSVEYEYIEKKFIEKFKNDFLKEGFSAADAEAKAQEEVSKHFVCITDKDENKSKLGKIAKEKGYKCGIIHDGCGGRFGAFDDHSLTALAYCGMSKEDMKKMLESSLKAQNRFLNTNLNGNTAAQRAMFNTDCVLKGKNNQYDYYFGDSFEGTALWNTQMKKESHKAQYKVSGDLVGPAFLHNSTESDLDKNNTSSFFTFNALKNDNSQDYKAYNALLDGSLKAYSSKHPLSLIRLNDLTPEAIGEFVELKHFEAMYTGMLLRTLKGEKHPQVLPEVEQPNVKIYKQEVEKILQN